MLETRRPPSEAPTRRRVTILFFTSRGPLPELIEITVSVTTLDLEHSGVREFVAGRLPGGRRWHSPLLAKDTRKWSLETVATTRIHRHLLLSR